MPFGAPGCNSGRESGLPNKKEFGDLSAPEFHVGKEYSAACGVPSNY
jgi:hypothetical protein